ncbi:MAG: PD-(D/E)XK nuclease family protein [Candidatus Hydrogenedentes bacterium]|nr:PD-(D/E)XK nuclease family protein [Candidatus Hydrogenedentota bacterium]
MSRVSVTCGSAFSRRIDEVREAFLSRFPSVILVVPTQKYATFWERMILNSLGKNCLTGRYVYDFTNFVRMLIEEEIGKCDIIEVWKQELVVSAILLSNEGKEKLDIYELQSPKNLAPHIVEVIRNLKQGGIEPEEFIKSIPDDFRKFREEIIYWVYSRYQEIMHRNEWYDVPGMFWMAEEVCRKKKPALLVDVDTILVEGFDDFTNSELRLLRALGGRVGNLEIFLNYDPSPQRQDLYRLSLKTLQKLGEIFSPEVKILDSQPPRGRIEFIAQNLYWRDSPRKIELEQGEVKISFYPNRDTEIRECAREIKRLIVEEHILPSRIALVFRKLNSVRKIIERTFKEFNVPYVIQYGQNFGDTRVGQFLFNWFTHLLNDNVLSLLQVFHHPLWNLPREVKVRVSYILRLLEVNLDHPIGVLEERLNQPIVKKSIPVDEDGEYSSEEETVSDEMISLFCAEVVKWLNWRKRFKEAQCISEFINAIEVLIREVWKNFLNLESFKSRLELQKNWRGLETFLLELKALPQLFGESIENLEALIEIICDLLEGIVVNVELSSGVFISELPGIRNLKFDYVFLCGVERGSIPYHRGLNALYSEKELSDISGKYSIPVETLETHLQRERLLFQKVFESANLGIRISFALFTESNSETEPSLLIKDVLELCKILDYDCGYKEGVLSAVELTKPCSNREMRLVRFLSLSPNRLQEEYSEEYSRMSIYKVRLGNEEGPFFGVVHAEDLVSYLSNWYSDKHIYSVDQIERYIDCPFLFFARRVLSLSDWEKDTEEPPPYIVGGWTHKILHYLLRDYLQKIISKENVREIVGDIVDKVVDSDCRSKFFPRGVIQVLKRRLKILIEAMINDCLISDNWTPTYFELSFGETMYEEKDQSMKNIPPFVWDINGRKILFSGRIDRVDTAEMDGKKVAKVVDYKFRKVPKQVDKSDEVSENSIVSIQLTLYGLVVEQHILKSESVKTIEGAFFLVYPEGGKRGREVKAKWSGDEELIQKWREKTGEKIVAVIDNIRNGYFVPEPREERICEHCGWLIACKYRKSLHRGGIEGLEEYEGDNE